ncbi:MAG TPA: DUF120 domain-containing protein [Bacillota bacterium]|jgi:hypothetical protein
MTPRFAGTVASGAHEAGGFVALPWFRDWLKSRFGFDPFSGTLNLRDVSPDGLAETLLRRGTALVPPSDQFCLSMVLPVKLDRAPEEPAAIVRPLVAAYPAGAAEIVAPVRLRERLGLADGDELAFQVDDGRTAGGWRAAGEAGVQAGGPAGVQAGAVAVDVETSGGQVRLSASWSKTADGITVQLYGGLPHVGAVAVAYPRPSLRDPSRPSATSSVLTRLGHKDDFLARPASELLAKALDAPAVVVAGVHVGPSGTYQAPGDLVDALIGAVPRLVEAIVAAVGRGS